MGSPVSSTFLGGLGSAATRILRGSSVRGVFVVTFPSHRLVSAVDLPGKNRPRHIFPQEVEPHGGRVPYPPGDRKVQPVRFFASATDPEFLHGQGGRVRAPPTHQASPFSKNTRARSFRPSSNIALSLSFSPFGLCEPSIDLPNSRKRSPDIWEALMAISVGDSSLAFSNSTRAR